MKTLFSLVLLIWCFGASAQAGPAAFSFDGTLLNASGAPIAQSNVNFKLEVMDKNATCVLYSETQTMDLSNTAGAFSLTVGLGSNRVNNRDGSAVLNPLVFLNNGTQAAYAGCPAGVTLAPGDGRNLRVSYDLGSGFVALSPNFPLITAPFAMVADTVGGKTLSELVQTRSDGSISLTQANIENLFSNVNLPKLQALINGTSSQYLLSNPNAAVGFNNQTLTNIGAPTNAQDAVPKNYADSMIAGKPINISGIGPGVGGGYTLSWDSAAAKWTAGPSPSFVNGGNSFNAPTSVGTNDSYGLGLRTNGFVRMMVTSAGSIGVGTTNPMGLFTVNGSGSDPQTSGMDSSILFRADNGMNSLDAGVSTNWSSAWLQARNSSINGSMAGLMLQPLGGSVGIGKMSFLGSSQVLKIGNNVGLPETLVISGGTSGNLITLSNYGTTPTTFTATGNVGIATPNPTTRLQVNGDISPAFDSAFTLGTNSLRFATIYAVNSVVQTSDARAKKEITDADLGLRFVNQLRPVSYRWRTGKDAGLHYGLIAQEVESALKGFQSEQNVIVSHDAESDRYGMKYTELIAPLIKAVQEVYAYVSSVDGELRALRAENEVLRRRLDALEAR